MFTRSIHTEIEIEASGQRVWDVIVDLPAYPQWNPLIHKVQGTLAVGSRWKMDVRCSGIWRSEVPVEILGINPGRELRWLGTMVFRGVLDGDHSLTIEPISENRMRLRQFEHFRGLLIPLVAPTLISNMTRGFEQMNLALKRRAEGKT